GIPYDTQWFTLTSGHASQQNLFADSKFWRTKFLDAYKQYIPFKNLDGFIGNPSANFQRVIGHPMVDAYYDAMVPTREQFAKITLPLLTITGQYDGDELGALTFYRDHLANASAETRAKHFLIIGPWDHAGTRTPTDEVGGGNGVFHSGTLSEKPAATGADEYIYDPLDVHRGEEVENVDNEKTAGLDQRRALSIGKDGLVYHSDPASKETTLLGCPKLTLW